MLLDLVYIYPGGVRTGLHLFFFGESAFLKHSTGDVSPVAMFFIGHTFRSTKVVIVNPYNGKIKISKLFFPVMKTCSEI